MTGENRGGVTMTMETGGTAMKIKSPSPAIRRLVLEWKMLGVERVLDYGAGHGRNADYLRSLGFTVYAYDPYNGDKTSNGWFGVSSEFPRAFRFDLAFTSFVLNVVQKEDEMQILSDIARISDLEYHIVRRDLEGPYQKATGNEEAMIWFAAHGVDDPQERLELGFPTAKGFQRHVVLDDYFYAKIHEDKSYAVYKK
jgi:hypothetical protein